MSAELSATKPEPPPPPSERRHEKPGVPPADAPQEPRFVLVGTSHPGNVGAAARAMKVMGFSDLVLVAPRDPGAAQHPEAVAMASGAVDVLARARVVGSLTEALEHTHWACATAMTPRDFGPPTGAPRDLFPAWAGRAVDEGVRPAFVFGSERFGLSNDDVYRCHACVSIPTAPGYGSLNLAQAVQVLAYEWRQALGGFEVEARTPPVRWADGAEVDGLLAHWREVLVQTGFLDPAVPRKLMPRLQQLLNRQSLTAQEVHILRGMARSVQAAARRSPAAHGDQG